MSKTLKFIKLPRAQLWLLVQAMVLLPMTALALRLISFRRWQVVLCKLAPEIPYDNPKRPLLIECQTTARIVKAASTYGFYKASCLQYAITLWWLLRRQEIDSNLRIGTRKEAGQIDAHAWVECAGIIINDDQAKAYQAFDYSFAPSDSKLS